MHVFECEDEVVGWRAGWVCWIVSNGLDDEVEKGEKRLAKRVFEYADWRVWTHLWESSNKVRIRELFQ